MIRMSFMLVACLATASYAKDVVYAGTSGGNTWNDAVWQGGRPETATRTIVDTPGTELTVNSAVRLSGSLTIGPRASITVSSSGTLCIGCEEKAVLPSPSPPAPYALAASTATWGGGSGSWHDESHWRGGSPSSTSVVVVPGPSEVTIDGSARVGGSVLVGADAYLRVSGFLQIGARNETRSAQHTAALPSPPAVADIATRPHHGTGPPEHPMNHTSVAALVETSQTLPTRDTAATKRPALFAKKTFSRATYSPAAAPAGTAARDAPETHLFLDGAVRSSTVESGGGSMDTLRTAKDTLRSDTLRSAALATLEEDLEEEVA